MALSGRAQPPAFAGRGRGSGAYVTWQNVDLIKAILGEIEDGLKYETNRELRQKTKDIATRIVIPQLKRAARSSRAPLARAFAETARAKADRVIVVQIGGVNPPLENFRRGRGVERATTKTRSGRDATSRNYRTSMAWGSEYGPFPGADVNNYGVPRLTGAGYWVTPGITNAIPGALKEYNAYLEQLLTTRGRNR
jgi:hypothetical protein